MSKNYTNQDLQKMLAGQMTAHVNALNGLIGKLPVALQAEIAALRDSFNLELAKLGPLDQVPAAAEISWGLDRLVAGCDRLTELANGLFSKLNQMSSVQTEHNALLDRVTKGELLEKATVLESLKVEREEGRKEMRPEIIATRKAALELAGLPLPEEAVLGLPAAEFTPRQEQMKKNVTEMGTKGFKIGGTGEAWVKRTAWNTATEFAGSMELIKDLHPGAKTEETKTTPDPLLGNEGLNKTTSGGGMGLC